MKYFFGIITFLYLFLAASLLTNHYGVAQSLAKYLFGLQFLLVMIYLLEVKFK